MSPQFPHLAGGPLLDHDGDTMGQSGTSDVVTNNSPHNTNNTSITNG